MPAVPGPGKLRQKVHASFREWRLTTAPIIRGGRHDPDKFTAAHRTLPFGTRVRVTDTRSQRSVVVVVNDRGPFIKGRVLDLSLAAAKTLRMTDRGLLKVTAVVE